MITTIDKQKTLKRSKDYQLMKPAIIVKNLAIKQIAIVSLIIVLIVGFITYDILFLKSESQNKAAAVNEKISNLQIYLNENILNIDNEIIIQQEQLQEFQNISK